MYSYGLVFILYGYIMSCLVFYCLILSCLSCFYHVFVLSRLCHVMSLFSFAFVLTFNFILHFLPFLYFSFTSRCLCLVLFAISWLITIMPTPLSPVSFSLIVSFSVHRSFKVYLKVLAWLWFCYIYPSLVQPFSDHCYSLHPFWNAYTFQYTVRCVYW